MLRNAKQAVCATAVATLMAVGTGAALTGCATTPQQDALTACEAYEQTLRALAVRRANGELSADSVATVNRVREMVNPICASGEPPEGSDAAKAVESGLDRLIEVKEQEAIND